MKTNEQVYREIEQYRDTVNFPYFNEEVVADFFHNKYLSYINSIIMQGESEMLRSRISPLIYTQELDGVKTFSTTEIEHSVFLIRNVMANMEFECRGIKRTITRPVLPITDDAIGFALDDPFSTPDDYFPLYMETSAGLEGHRNITIYSKTTPKGIIFTYVKMPKKIDFLGDPNGYMEVNEMAQKEIIKGVVSELSAIIPDARYNGLKNEQI